jgi:RNA polymerase sigma factor (sigma-70 family)
LPDVHTLYLDHYAWLVARLQRQVRCRHIARDLAQDTFVRVLTRPLAALQARQPRAWLGTIAHGLMVDHFRRRELELAYHRALLTLPQVSVATPEDELSLLQHLIDLDALLRGLATKPRQALLLSRLGGLNHAEIAQRLAVSISSVEKYIATALHHCINRKLASRE